LPVRAEVDRVDSQESIISDDADEVDLDEIQALIDRGNALGAKADAAARAAREAREQAEQVLRSRRTTT
jgi:ElaB/YqjD/DUF883 family membrane-anchored ribosome-binding protein